MNNELFILNNTFTCTVHVGDIFMDKYMYCIVSDLEHIIKFIYYF